MKNLLGSLMIVVSALAVVVPTQAALLDRDLDKNGVTDAFYDTDLNITWLRDADINGRHIWIGAFEWVSSLTFGGYGDWRLPSTTIPASGYNITSSEMGHLWYVELGNTVGEQPKTGNFDNLRTDYYYWSGTETATNSNGAWNFSTYLGGRQDAFNKSYSFYAMAVRDGDVTAVPEPETYALMLAGVGLVSILVRRKKTKSNLTTHPVR